MYLCPQVGDIMLQDIIINNSTELYRITTDEFVYAIAGGNYTDIYLNCLFPDKCVARKAHDDDSNTYNDSKRFVTVSMQLGKLEKLITEQVPREQSTLARVGNSYIVNLDYVFYVKPAKQQLVLRDWSGHFYPLNKVPVEVLKKLKAAISMRANINKDNTQEGVEA